MDYNVPNPAPAIRRRVTPKAIGDVAPRDFDRVQSQMQQSIDDLFKRIQGEYQQVRLQRACVCVSHSRSLFSTVVSCQRFC